MKDANFALNLTWLNKKTLLPILKFLFREVYNSPTMRDWAKSVAEGRKVDAALHPDKFIHKR